MKKKKLDCPVCSVFMTRKAGGYWICPVCFGMFAESHNRKKLGWTAKVYLLTKPKES